MINKSDIVDTFRNHVVTIHEKLNSMGGEIEFLRWQKPGELAYSIDYFAQGGVLFVKGDYGEAVYAWYNPKLDLEWMTRHDIGYFAEKCKASEVGHKYRDWSVEVLNEHINEFLENDERSDNPTMINTSESWREAFRDAEGLDALRSDMDWHDWLYSPTIEGQYVDFNRTNVERFFGENWEELRVENWGWEIHSRVLIHMEGLRMAFEWLKTNKLLPLHSEIV